jgi:hypothetical protein
VVVVAVAALPTERPLALFEVDSTTNADDALDPKMVASTKRKAVVIAFVNFIACFDSLPILWIPSHVGLVVEL